MLLLLCLALTLAFEPVHPVWATPWLEINQLKLLVGASAVVWAAQVVWQRRAPRVWRCSRPLVLAAAGFVLVATLSAVLAGSFRLEALKFVGRLASGVLVLLLTVEVTSTEARLRQLVWAVIVGAGLSACLGLGEAAGWTLLDPLLAEFKVAPTLVGGDLRVSASFQYATIAAMFFELAVPLALVAAATATRRSSRWLATAIALACTVVVVLSLTRAGIGVLLAILALLLGLAWTRPRYRSLLGPSTVAALGLVGVFVGLATHVASFGTRLSTENDLGWYAATYDAPASVSLSGDSASFVTVAARNTGQATWTAHGEHAYALGYYWLTADGLSALRLAPVEVPLPHDVASGETVQVPLELQPPLPPGDYRLAWGMLQHDVVWFHYRGSPDAETLVHVSAGAGPPPPAPGVQARDDQPALPLVVARRELWTAALRMFAEHPLLGVGPDNFRHVSGTYLGLAVWDDRVHANDLYLEMLADLGIVGAAALAILLAPAVVGGVRLVRDPPAGPLALLGLGLAASLLAFFLHGLLDYFLEFTPVYLLFWLIVGLLLAAQSLRRDSSPA
jgi:O-antigen ligase/polysaccharide polymerase Wzy-like membrane protein